VAVQANGNLVLVFLDRPEVHEINPRDRNPVPKLLHRFEGSSHVTGITEISPGVFAVIVGKNLIGNTLGGEWSLWKLDLNGSANSPQVTKITANIPKASLMNGLELLSPQAVLASDTVQGTIYRIDLQTGTTSFPFKSKELRGGIMSNVNFGLNGIKISGNYLYYTNTLGGAFVKIPIDRVTGAATGKAKVLATGLTGLDDFAIAPSGNEAFLVNQFTNEVVRVDLSGTDKVEKLAGNPKSGLILGPCAAAFGRSKADERTLYVVTSGQAAVSTPKDAGPLGGKILALNW
jgi:hypothetical protein